MNAKTHNGNEVINIIWTKCPTNIYGENDVMEVGVKSAVRESNGGPSGTHSVLNHVIDNMEYILLYNVSRVNRPSLKVPYWQYQRFDLNRMTDDECKVEGKPGAHLSYQLS